MELLNTTTRTTQRYENEPDDLLVSSSIPGRLSTAQTGDFLADVYAQTIHAERLLSHGRRDDLLAHLYTHLSRRLQEAGYSYARTFSDRR